MSYLRYLCFCAIYIMLCFRFVCLRFVYPMLPVSLQFPFLIAPSEFSNVYSIYTFYWVRIPQSLVFCVVFCKSIFIFLSFLLRPWYCLSFVEFHRITNLTPDCCVCPNTGPAFALAYAVVFLRGMVWGNMFFSPNLLISLFKLL